VADAAEDITPGRQ